MDYLTFGLLAGSVIVIASFLLRDAAPHLSALSPSPPLGRLSRRAAPLAWRRWCADAGLVVSAAGTLVLLATVGALVADVADGAGTIVVALALTAALVGAALVLARLTVRYQDDVATELSGASVARPGVRAPTRVATPEPSADLPVSLPTTRITHAPTTTRGVAAHDVAPVVAAGTELWEDDLPTWSGASTEAAPTVRPIAAQPPKHRSPETHDAAPSSPSPLDVSDEPEDHSEGDHVRPPVHVPSMEPRARGFRPVGRGWDADPMPAAVDPIGGAPAATVIGGSFSSPLLADIGLPPANEASNGFRSRILLDLDRTLGDEAGDEVETGSDIVLDESPAPAFPSTRGRDELS